MRIVNTNQKLSNETIHKVIRFVCPLGLHNFTVKVKNSKGKVAGRAYCESKKIVCRINPHRQYPLFVLPYQYGQLKGKKYWIASLEEMLVYITAHEIRHLWQAKAKNKRGYFHGARGRFSEIDTESYAIQCLRRWRKASLIPT